VSSPLKDQELLELAGSTLVSARDPNTSYRLERVIGEGAHGVVYLAQQRSGDLETSTVIKLLRPRALRAGLGLVTLGKEVAALELLSKRTPPTPYIVQLLDSGSVRVRDGLLDLPWLAVEYVQGGDSGTTLRTRVEASITQSGHAFNAERACLAIHCIASGLTAIHEVGVVHRDVNPGNVLCTGTGAQEIFKVADFGLARVSSVTTFGNVLLGTPGYCAPEQSFPDKVGVGPYSDVFSLACCAYFVLTGERYFSAPTIPEMLVEVHGRERRSLLEARALCPELQENPGYCRQLDALLAHATHADPHARPPSADAFGKRAVASLQAAP